MISPHSTALAAGLMFALAPLAHAAQFPEVGPVPPRRPAEIGAAAPAPAPPAAALSAPSPATASSAEPAIAEPSTAEPVAAEAAPPGASGPAKAPAPQPGDIPVPRPRPSQFDRLAALPPVAAPERPEALPGAGPAFCAALMASGRVEGKLMPRVADPGGCGIESPIQLSAIFLGDGTRIPVEPASLMRCQLADALAIWVRTDVATAAEKAGSKLARIQSAAAYVCRGRNRIAGAMMSEHGLGNAFDLRGVTLASGRMLSIDKSAESRPFMEALRSSACARFKTILGPGSDGYHEDHLHVDLRERRGKSSFCQWTLR